MRVIHVLSAIVLASLATACGHKDSSSGSSTDDPIGGDSQVASEASTQSEHFGNDLFANVDPTKDAATNGAAVEASSGAKLWPPSCVTRKRDASCNAQSCVVHVTFDDCTGPFGLVHIQGGDDITITQNGSGGLTATLASVNLTANGHPVDHTATADVSLDANGGRTIHWQGHWARTRDDGVDVDHTSDLTIVADPAARCRTSNGSTKTVTSKREIDGTVTNYQACWGVVDGFVEEYCPSGTLSYASSGKTASIAFDGSRLAEVTGPRGNTVEWPLVCPAKPLRARFRSW